MNSEQKLQSQLKQMRHRYLLTLNDKLLEINEYWDVLKHDSKDTASWSDLCMCVHKLSGIGSTIGLPELSASAGKLEEKLYAINQNTPFSESLVDDIQRCINELMSVSKRLQNKFSQEG